MTTTTSEAASAQLSPLKLVIKTPLYSNYASSLTHSSESSSGPEYSTDARFNNIVEPFPTAAQIASDIILQIQTASNYKSSIECQVRKNILLSFKPRLIAKIEIILARSPRRTYKALDDIVILCLRDLGF